ncbi:hypothetical protein DGMP_32650 [Desulfomarina profundi]|uniref:Uncharacterized protein n=1 Tax=Desulfomarina profundi TaxID=2772557 RepID=A0A8D5JND6_9BACT|nr:hypothetical protein [Desulfomarina profundi]BCL62572.1 hypothetical protein DGMP_32650 [Desulfomarina profundi]
MEVKILSAKFDMKDANRLEVAKQHGAYATLDKLFSMKPEEVIAEVRDSGLRDVAEPGFPPV